MVHRKSFGLQAREMVRTWWNAIFEKVISDEISTLNPSPLCKVLKNDHKVLGWNLG